MARLLYTGEDLYNALANGAVDFSDMSPSDGESFLSWIETIIREKVYAEDAHGDTASEMDSMEDRHFDEVEDLRNDIIGLETEIGDLLVTIKELEEEIESLNGEINEQY